MGRGFGVGTGFVLEKPKRDRKNANKTTIACFIIRLYTYETAHEEVTGGLEDFKIDWA